MGDRGRGVHSYPHDRVTPLSVISLYIYYEEKMVKKGTKVNEGPTIREANDTSKE